MQQSMASVKIRLSSRKEIDLDNLMPLLCVLITFKSLLSYYKYITGSLSIVVEYIYTGITLLLFVLYIPLSLYVCVSGIRFRSLWPTIIIPLFVIANILFAAFQGGLGVFSRSFRLELAIGTNDEYGYYFAQINTWFCNMSSVILLASFIRRKETIIKCVYSSLIVLAIPIIVIIIMHPSYLGLRQSSFEETNITFGGGLWNIGVVGFGSLGWLTLTLQDSMSKRKKIISLFVIALLVFVGVAGISRTLILMVAFSAAYYFMFSRKNSSWLKKIVIIILLLVIFCLVEYELIISIIARFSSGDAGIGNVRFKLWSVYLSHFGDCWLIGAPYGSVYNYYRDYNYLGHYYLPHSAIINFTIRFGLLSCVSYLFLIKKSFLPTLNALEEKKKYCFRAGMIAYITLAFINQTGYAEPIFYMMFGLWMALSRVYDFEEAGKN